MLNSIREPERPRPEAGSLKSDIDLEVFGIAADAENHRLMPIT